MSKETEEKIVDANEGERNCTVCGAVLPEGQYHLHEREGEGGDG